MLELNKMGRQKIIAGNWKMNKTLNEAVALIQDVLKNVQENNALKIFFPPFPLIPAVAKEISGESVFKVGAQNCSEHTSGAYTGEVSAAILASIGCNFVLIGHSERRQYFNETNALLLQKTKQALVNNLKVIYCIGETLNERKSNAHFDVVKSQLTEVLSALTANEISNIILAYEPVWAIGTGETASPQQAQEMHAFIRTCIKQLFDEAVADNIHILYGGSCNAQNAKELFACQDIDGGLIGGASLKADDFCKIIASV